MSQPISLAHRQQKLTATGFGNFIQASGGHANQVLIQARFAVTGGGGYSRTANADSVLIFVGDSTPTTADRDSMTALASGDQLALSVSDVGRVWICGANGDSVTILIIE